MTFPSMVPDDGESGPGGCGGSGSEELGGGSSFLYVTVTVISCAGIVPVTVAGLAVYPSSAGDWTLYISPAFNVSVWVSAAVPPFSYWYFIVRVCGTFVYVTVMDTSSASIMPVTVDWLAVYPSSVGDGMLYVSPSFNVSVCGSDADEPSSYWYVIVRVYSAKGSSPTP